MDRRSDAVLGPQSADPAVQLPAHLSSWFPFAVYWAAVRLVRRLPRAVATRAGRASGLLAYLALPRRRRLAAENVALALPDRSAAEQRRIVRASFVQLGRTYWETTWAARLSTAEMLRRVDVEGVLEPWIVKLTPFLARGLPTGLSDAIADAFGASSSMDQWQGHGKPSG